MVGGNAKSTFNHLYSLPLTSTSTLYLTSTLHAYYPDLHDHLATSHNLNLLQS